MKKNLNVTITALQALGLQPVSDFCKAIKMAKDMLFFPSSLVPVLVKVKRGLILM